MSDDVFAMAADEANNVQATEDDLGKISFLAQQSSSLDVEIKNLEELLKEKKREAQKINEQDLPEAMDKVNMTEFKLTDGTKISIKTFYNASIPPERKDEAYTWLDDNGYGPLIKSQVAASFGREELEIAKQFLDYCKQFPSNSLEVGLEQSIHWQTLRAFIRESVESGAALPLDLFGVFIGRKAEIKQPKK